MAATGWLFHDKHLPGLPRHDKAYRRGRALFMLSERLPANTAGRDGVVTLAQFIEIADGQGLNGHAGK